MRESQKLSVFLPCYNEELRLPECLDSLLSQTHSNIEIQIFENASSDSTRDIIRKFQSQDSRIKLIAFDTHVSRSIQGLRMRHAPKDSAFIAFRSANDIVHKDFFSECMDLLLSDPTICLAYSHGTHLDLLTGVESHSSDFLKIDTRALDPTASCLQVVSRYTHSFSLWGVYRRSVFDQTSPSYHYGADHIQTAEMALLGAIAPTERRLNTMTINSNEGTLEGIERMWRTHHPLTDRGLPVTSPFMTLDIWLPFTSMIIGHLKMIASAKCDDRMKPYLQKSAKAILVSRFESLIGYEHENMFKLIESNDIEGICQTNQLFRPNLLETLSIMGDIRPESLVRCRSIMLRAMN